MRVDRGLLGWGLFLILLGGIPLAVQQGWIPSDLRWWELWPLILVGIGLSILLRFTRFAVLGGLVVAATFGVIAGGILANGIGGVPVVGCAGAYGTSFPERTGQLTGERAEVDLSMGCGDLDVSTAGGSDWRLTGLSEGGTPPIVENSATDLRVRMHEGDAIRALFQAKSRWEVTLPTGPRLGLSASVNAGSGSFDLAGASLDHLSVTTNAGDSTVDLGQAVADRLSLTVNAGSAKVQLPDGSMTGSVTVNAGSAALCAPPDVALRLTSGDNITGSYDYGQAGLQEVSDNVWQSPDWASATKRIELSTSANAGSISLDPEGGCR